MSRQTLKDERGNTIGYIDLRSDGVLVGKDARNNAKGTYNPKTDRTQDARGNTVGSGNLLAVLITQPLG